MLKRITLLAMLIIGIAAFASAQPPTGGPEGGAPAGAPGGAPGGDTNVNEGLDMTPVYVAMDADKNGKVTKEEWLASGMNQNSYDHLFLMLDKDGDGYLTEEDIMAAIPVFKVDMDGDGKASMKEFADANAQAAIDMGVAD